MSSKNTHSRCFGKSELRSIFHYHFYSSWKLFLLRADIFQYITCNQEDEEGEFFKQAMKRTFFFLNAKQLAVFFA